MSSIHMMAFWLAALCTLLLSPQIWMASVWLGDNVLAQQFGYDLVYWLRFAVFGMLFMSALYAARAGLGTSLSMAALYAVSKLPVF